MSDIAAVAVFGLALAPALLLVVGACAVWLQPYVLYPAAKAQVVLESPHHRVRAIAIPVNGKVLRGFLAVPVACTSRPRGLLYFNGRRENPTSIFRALPDLPDWHVLCFFYDKLGWSWRKPDQPELAADGLAVLDWWVREAGIAVEDLGVAGRSLGSGLAVHAAAARRVGSLALISPYDQLIAVVRARLPWAPRWLLRSPVNPSELIGKVGCPCLLVIAAEDTTIPVDVSRALFETWEGSLTEFVLRNCGHRGVLRRQETHRALADFLVTRPSEIRN